MTLEWLGEAIKVMYNSPEPWLTAFGLVIALLIVLTICGTIVMVSRIENKPSVVDKEKENKKNRLL